MNAFDLDDPIRKRTSELKKLLPEFLEVQGVKLVLTEARHIWDEMEEPVINKIYFYYSNPILWNELCGKPHRVPGYQLVASFEADNKTELMLQIESAKETWDITLEDLPSLCQEKHA